MDAKEVKEKATEAIKIGADKVNKRVGLLPFRAMAEKKISAETKAKYPILDKLIPFANQIVCGAVVVLVVVFIACVPKASAPGGGGSATSANAMTISGVWLREKAHGGSMFGTDGEKMYYYFSPGDNSGTAVGISITPDILGGVQVMPFTGTWDFEEKDGKKLFCVYNVRAYVSGMFIGGGGPMPGQRIYRFFSENKTQKMEFGEGENREVWIKVGTKLSDLPEVGILAERNMEGGKFWAVNGIIVK